MELEAWQLQDKDRQRQAIFLAWHVHAIGIQVRTKKRLPALKQLLEQLEDGGGPQTVGQMRSALEVLAENTGIKLRKSKVVPMRRGTGGE